MNVTLKAVQDWEYAEEIRPNEWETVDIQIETENEAIMRAQDWANKTGHRFVVSTSIRYESAQANAKRIVKAVNCL